MIYLPAAIRDTWHRYTGQTRTPSPGKYARAVRGEVLRSLRMIEADCTVNAYGKYLHSLVHKFTDDRTGSKAFRGYVSSVEDCLWLFPSDAFVVFMQRNPNFCIVNIRRVEDVQVVAARAEGKTLEIALLRAYWYMQSEGL